MVCYDTSDTLQLAMACGRRGRARYREGGASAITGSCKYGQYRKYLRTWATYRSIRDQAVAANIIFGISPRRQSVPSDAGMGVSSRFGWGWEWAGDALQVHPHSEARRLTASLWRCSMYASVVYYVLYTMYARMQVRAPMQASY